MAKYAVMRSSQSLILRRRCCCSRLSGLKRRLLARLTTVCQPGQLRMGISLGEVVIADNTITERVLC